MRAVSCEAALFILLTYEIKNLILSYTIASNRNDGSGRTC